MNCLSCRHGSLTKILSLGHHPPSDGFLTEEQLSGPETFYPLELFVCDSCGLVQIGYVVEPKVLFNSSYPYATGSNKEGVKHFNSLADGLTERFKLTEKDLVIDVGSNDGTLLKGFLGKTRVLGVEPCENLALRACKDGVPTICSWFNGEIATKNTMLGAKVITACNVFAHVHDINGFISTVKAFLAEDGIFIIESPYLWDMIDGLEYDTIYHEHLFYWAYKPLARLLGKYGMEVFDMEKQSVHGGTMRYYIGNCGQYDRVRFRVVSVREAEDKRNTGDLYRFAADVYEHKHELRRLIKRIKDKGKTIAGVSAPAKGNTLLNYCKLDSEYIDYITEVCDLKVGKFAPGTHLPIVKDEVLLEKKPDYALLLAWNWKDQIIGNLGDYVKNGGRFIIPIPTPRVEAIGSGVWAGYEL